MKNKIAHILLCIMLCMAFIPAAAFADSTSSSVPDGIWTDQAADSFAGGSGTKDDPYQIAKPEQLAKLAKDVNGGETYAGKYFKLTADLDLSKHVWMPIGLQRTNGGSWELISKPFAGSFDGGGRTISGMVVDQRKSLSERYSGGFVGRDIGSVYRNCTAAGELSGYYSLGGFVGFANYFNGNNKDVESVFEYCLADVDITADDWCAGGFMGWAKYAHIFNCVAKGNVTSTKSNEDPRAGAFVGVMEGCNIEKSHAAGRVTEVAPDYEAGGFAAHFFGSGNKFKDCSFDSTLNNDIKAIGGKIPQDYEGITGVPTQQVKANICRDYDGTHDLKEVPGKAATCTEDGHEAYWKCGACGSMYADKDQTTMITEPKVIKKTGHKLTSIAEKAATCTEDGYEAYWKCEACGLLFADENGTEEISQPEVIKATGHDLVKKDGKAASSTEDGYREYWECSTCKKLFSDAKGQHEISNPEVIKATGESADKHDNGKSASTGDSSMPFVYGLLAAAALAGGAAVVVTRKKREN